MAAAADLAAAQAEAARALDRGEHVQAIELLTRALVGGADSEPLVQRRALRTLTLAHVQLGDFEAALPLALTSARLELAAGDEAGQARALVWLGLCHGLLGDTTRGEKLLRAGAREARRIGRADLQRSALNNLVYVVCVAVDGLRAAGREAEAREQLARLARDVEVVESLDDQRDDYVRTLWQTNHAAWLHRVGQLARAAQMYEQAYLRAVPHDWVEVARHAALGLGQIAQAGGDADAARRWLVRAVAVADGADPCGFVADAHARLAQLLTSAGDVESAARHRQHRLALLDRLHVERRRVRQLSPESFPFDAWAQEAAQPLAQLLDQTEQDAQADAAVP